jgi:hypothetical protein
VIWRRRGCPRSSQATRPELPRRNSVRAGTPSRACSLTGPHGCSATLLCSSMRRVERRSRGQNMPGRRNAFDTTPYARQQGARSIKPPQASVLGHTVKHRRFGGGHRLAARAVRCMPRRSAHLLLKRRLVARFDSNDLEAAYDAALDRFLRSKGWDPDDLDDMDDEAFAKMSDAFGRERRRASAQRAPSCVRAPRRN